jgi:acyl-CoA synthetase (NDP forming)/GNAT superfamily N-acetyltransferase
VPPVPAELDGLDVVLRDGGKLRIRSICPQDEPALAAMLERLSPRSRWFRFFSGAADMHQAARAAVADDGVDGLVALAGDPEEVVGHALWVRERADAAEVAFEVADRWQGHGIGTLLLGRAVAMAAADGIATLTAYVLPGNHAMIQVFRDSGFPVRVHTEPGELFVELATEVGPEVARKFEERDRIAAAAAVDHFVRPASVAVIGASARPGSVGCALAENLSASFEGPLHRVGRGHSVADVDGSVELAVIAVSPDDVERVAHDCAAKGVKALLVISAGFEDEDGRERRRKLGAYCRATGMRMVGPNCLGIASPSLNATFARSRPLPGRVALVSQSGGVGIAALERARRHGIGFSVFASIGDRADLSSNDFLQQLEGDPGTDVIALYLESFGNPRKFARVARRVSRTKPIIAVKGGRTRAGNKAAGSHTGALVSGSDATVDALFAQSGVIRTESYRDMLDLAALLSTQPAPAGTRLGVVTNAGGPAILLADAAEGAGLSLPGPSAATARALRAALPEAAAVGNPVDVLGDATPERLRAAVAAMAGDDAFDALAVVYVPTPPLPPDRAAAAVAEAAGHAAVPVVTAFLTEEPTPEALRSAGIPDFGLPEDAARALGAAARRGQWLAKPDAPLATVTPPPDRDAAAALVAEALAYGGGWMAADAVRRLAKCYGLPIAPQRLARTPAEAADAAVELGGHVAIKAVAPGLVHKSDAGAVALGIRGKAATQRAAREMSARLRAAGRRVDGFLVQAMAAPGTELLVGVTSDPVFGPVVACAAGGTATELLADSSIRLAPLSEADVHDMPRELATFPLLRGHRGAPPADVGALEDVLRRVSALADDLPAIAELDCNPVVVGPAGAVIVDMRVRVEAPATHPAVDVFEPPLSGDRAVPRRAVRTARDGVS